MNIKLALVGNPNCGKTTMFNALTGSAQYVGNWPGVTVEKKEGFYKNDSNIVLTDLPGIYSLSPYTPEEVVARNYLTISRPDAIINLVDATNIERNLYLTTQLSELNIPIIIALNMMDVVRKNGDEINIFGLQESLGCQIVPVSALKNIGLDTLMRMAIALVKNNNSNKSQFSFNGYIESALSGICNIISEKTDSSLQRWYAVKLFERDSKVYNVLNLSRDERKKIFILIENCEKRLNDDSESLIISGRYDFVEKTVKRFTKKKNKKVSISDMIDTVLTNRLFAIPIFATVMFLVYYFAITVVGGQASSYISDIVFSRFIGQTVINYLHTINASQWVIGVISDGIVRGVGSVLGFVPQMVVLFLLLCILEDCGYMSRIAFIMDRIFRLFGLSGKSFIPLLVGSGCSVPGIMASRTIEKETDRRMTIITTSFIPCGAKMPVIALFAGALFENAWWVAPISYFIGVTAVIFSGIILKKTSLFYDENSPFVMELPPYHMPNLINVLRGTWDRSFSFVKRAGTVILFACIIVWFTSNFGIADNKFVFVYDMNNSILAYIGNAISFLFIPLGFGNWQSSVSTILGLLAKEEIVGSFSILYGGQSVSVYFTILSGFSFLIFNLLCAPCIAAISTIYREMNSVKWTLFAVCYQTIFAYCISLIFYQFGLLFIGCKFSIFSTFAVFSLALLIYMLIKPYKSSIYSKELAKV